MGKVYTLEQVKNGSIPSRGAQRLAAREMLRAELDIVGQEINTVGILVHGSTARREANIRSDVDILAVLPDELTAHEQETYTLTLEEIAFQFDVAVEPLIVNQTDAAEGRHTIDALFLEYLAQAEAIYGMVKKRPGILSVTGLITPYESDPLDSLDKYVIAKRDKFLKQGNSEDYVDVRVLQRCLELPSAMRRRFLQAFNVDVTTTDNPAIEELQKLGKLDKQYTGLLRDAVRTGDTSAYNAVLGNISSEAVSFARIACISLAEYSKLLRQTTAK